jgi:hypothetical protein
VKYLRNTEPLTLVQTIVTYDNAEIRSVKFLEIDFQTTFYLPRGWENKFDNLEGIEVHDSKLKFISKDDISPFPNLKELKLWKNDLERLDSDLFETNPEIRFIDFTQNKLKIVGRNILSPLRNLLSAKFEYNFCISMNSGFEQDIQKFKLELEEMCTETISNRRIIALEAEVEDLKGKYGRIIKILEELREYEIKKVWTNATAN